MKEVDMAMLVDGVAKVISGAPFPSKQSLSKARKAVEFVLAAPALDIPSLAERDQLRADKREMAAEAVRWAEEAGRLKALMHDAQRDAERYQFIRAGSKEAHEAVLGDFTDEIKSGDELDCAIDAAMAAEREDHSCPNCLGVHLESCVFAEREVQG